jgi:kynurenine 3-monooxygenase
MSDHPARFVVVGAGLAGGLMTTLLGRAGFPVLAIERRPDPRRAGAAGGRSINLALSARGLFALDQVGLKDTILGLAVPLYGRMIHPVKGRLAFQPYGTRGQAIQSLSRTALNATLLDAAEAAGAEIRFGYRCAGLDLPRGEVLAERSADAGDAERLAGTIVGCDGAYSAVRAELQRRDRQDFSQTYLSHGYRELSLPPAPDGGFRLDPNALHIWPRGGFMMMAMANRDGSFTVTIYLPFEGVNSFATLGDPEAVRRFFEAQFPDAIPLLPGLEDAWFGHPTGSLMTIRTRPWQVGGKVVLIGDACHAIVPFFGQGANAAFEDCVALRDALLRKPNDRSAAFASYEAERRPNTEAIADLALDNFHEMRDSVASPLFRLEKRAEVGLHRVMPRWFIPLYTMISFTRIPYAEARVRAARQGRILRRVAAAVALGILILSGWALWGPR